jgi:hypothetical protein
MKQQKKQKGFTLLEYAAGAAVIIGIVWLGVNTMGDGISNMLEAIGNWASQQGNNIGGGGSGNP